MSKARKTGWHRQDDSYDTWIETFRSFEYAGVLPSAEKLRAASKKSEKELVNGV